MGRLNSLILWDNKGCITGHEACNKVVAKQVHTDSKAAEPEKQEPREQPMANAEATLAAVSAPETVRDPGGGTSTEAAGLPQYCCGSLTKVLLTQVVIWFNQRLGHCNKVAGL